MCIRDRNNFGNYIRLWDSGRLQSAIGITLVFVLATVALTFVIALALALMLNTKIRGARLLRSLMMIPWVVPTVIAGLLWSWIYANPYGLLQYLVSAFTDVYKRQDNELSGISFELLGKARDLAADLNTNVTAVLIGSDVKNLCDALAEYGADRVIVVDDPELKVYRTEPYTHALASVINEYKPEIMLVGATAIGRDLGPRVSARVATGLTADLSLIHI